MEVHDVALATLACDPRNARKHNSQNIAAITKSLELFGQQKPIVVNQEGTIIAGNGTFEAAKAMGWATIQVVRTELGKRDATAFALADNRTSELAEWDDDILNATLADLFEQDFDIEGIGFDEPTTEGGGATDDDAVPDIPENENPYNVERGQIWQLGEHRIMCGDSTSKEDVDELMNGEKADMVFTDPPYGMFLDADYSSMASKFKGSTGGNAYSDVIGDNEDFTPELVTSVLNNFSYCKEVFLWGADYYSSVIGDVNKGSWIVWDKRKDDSADKMFGSCFELCWSKTRHKRDIARVKWAGIFGMETQDTKKRCHPTQKPIDLAQWFFDKWGIGLTNIVDIYLGSGSTLIACEKTGRKCYGMEIDPHYCSVIIKRWQDFTGKEASLNG